MTVERVYMHHDRWEDHRSGQYAMVYADQELGSRRAADLLRSPDRLWAAMSAVVREWPNATAVNLSHVGQNRQAWLGQAACCFTLGVPAFVTKAGWWTLDQWEMDAANDVADQVIDEWEATVRAETLFD